VKFRFNLKKVTDIYNAVGHSLNCYTNEIKIQGTFYQIIAKFVVRYCSYDFLVIQKGKAIRGRRQDNLAACLLNFIDVRLIAER
jgi:hypothetical protein